MGVLVAQELEIVRGEIDDQQAAGGPQHARRRVDRARAVVEEVQHLMDDDGVEGVLGQREVVDVALAHAAMAQPGAIEPRAGEREHVEREIESQAALDARPEQFEHAPGAGAEIEQRAQGAVRERAADGVLDRRVGDMELADAVPLRRVAAEIGLRGVGALRPHRRQALPVARQRGVVGIETGDEFARQFGGAAALAQAEERPRSFAETIDQPGLGEEPQMPRNPGLRLPQDGGEVRDGELGLAQERENAQAGALPGGLERAVEDLEPQVGSGGHGVGGILNFSGAHRFQGAYKDIFIRLSGEYKAAMGRLARRSLTAPGSTRQSILPARHPPGRRPPRRRPGTDGRETAGAKTTAGSNSGQSPRRNDGQERP